MRHANHKKTLSPSVGSQCHIDLGYLLERLTVLVVLTLHITDIKDVQLCKKGCSERYGSIQGFKARTAADVHGHSILNSPSPWRQPHAKAGIVWSSFDPTIEQTPSPALGTSILSAFELACMHTSDGRETSANSCSINCQCTRLSMRLQR